MSSQVKEIVERLNASPFKMGLTLISFDGLEPIQLLQVLNDVFAEINAEYKATVREEDPEDTMYRMLEILRALKYKPPSDSQSTFRQGLVQGHREVIYPILEWTLSRIEDLKKRAYLARFLVKVEVPAEMMADQQVVETYEKYTALIEEFKETHKELEGLKKTGYSAAEIKRDIASMISEKEQLEKRIERMRKKAEGINKHEEMLAAAHSLRVEHDREAELQRNRDEQRDQLMAAEEKLQRMHTQLREVRNNSVSGGVQGLLSRLEDEAKMNTYLSQDKLPQALGEREKTFADLQRVLEQPSMTRNDLDDLHRRIQELTAEINKLIEKRMVSSNPADDKLALFKQQATLIARKKQAVADTLKESADELADLQRELEKKKTQGKRTGPRMLKPDEFKSYVAKLRGLSTTYKARKQELADLRAEALVLAHTEEILKAENTEAGQTLSNLAAEKGVEGFQDVQEQLESVSERKSELDRQKGETLDDISAMVKELTQTIASKKTSLAPLIKELRNVRTQAQDLQAVYDEKKSAYDAKAAGLESNKSRIEQEVRALREETAQDESRYHYLNNMLAIMEVQLQRVREEMKNYKAGDASGKRPKSYRDVYQKKIQEQENLGKTLKEKQKIVRDSHEPNMVQLDMWRDLLKLFECKQRATSSGPSQRVVAMEEPDRLVL